MGPKKDINYSQSNIKRNKTDKDTIIFFKYVVEIQENSCKIEKKTVNEYIYVNIKISIDELISKWEKCVAFIHKLFSLDQFREKQYYYLLYKFVYMVSI